MAEPTPSREDRVNKVIAAYLTAVEAGQTPDRQELLARHPDLAEELAGFFWNEDKFEHFAAALPAAPAAPQVSPADAPTLAPAGAPDLPAGNSFSGPPTEPSADNSIGSLGTVRYFGDYELLEEIARGGMGVVYKARQVSLNRVVALKMILAGQLASALDVQRFRTEAEAAANLDHPNIVPIYEVGEHGGQHYFSMKLVEGGSLANCLSEPRPSGSEGQRAAAGLVANVARAVHYAHQRGIIHRDLKPANILLAKTEKAQTSGSPLPAAPCLLPTAYCPLITDFGLAKRLEGDANLSRSGAIVGTPAYMAPEQAAGTKGLTTAADIYSLGAILYELLTGKPPFVGATPMDILLQVMDKEPTPPRQVQPGIDCDLETICLKCLDKDPQKRYGTAEALAEDLERWQAGEPIEARPNTTWERGLKWVKRRPAAAGLMAVSGLSILSLLVLAGISWQNAEMRAEAVQDLGVAKAEVAEQQGLVVEKRAEVQRLEQLGQQERANTQKAQETARRILYAADMQFAHAAWERNNISSVLTLLERHVPQADQKDFREFEWHYLRRLCHRDRLTLNAPVDSGSKAGFAGFTSIVFSKDGKTLAAATPYEKPNSPGEGGAKVRLWDVATGKETGAFVGPDILFTLAFAPDGKGLVASMMRKFKKGDLEPEAKAMAEADSLWAKGKGQAKPSLQRLLWMHQVQAFTLDGRKLGEPEKADPGRHLAPSGQLSLMPYGDVRLKGQIFHGQCVAVSADRKTLAFGGFSLTIDFAKPFPPASPQKAVLFWDLTKGEPHTVLKGLTDVVWAMAFSPDGKTLAVADGKIIKLCEVPTGKQLLALKGHDAVIGSVTFSADGKTLASGSVDGTIKVWDAGTGDELNTLKGHREMVTSVAFAPDGKTLASVSADGVIKLWDPRAAQGPTRFKLDNDIVHLAFEPSGKSLTATTDVGTRVHWDVATGQERSTGKITPFHYSRSTISPDGKTLATADFGGVVKLRDALTSKELRDLKGHKAYMSHMAFSPDGQVLATASQDKTVRLWDVGTGAERCALPVHAFCLAFSPDGRTLATGTKEKTVKIWDVASGKERSVLPGHPHRIRSLRFSADGTRLAAAGEDTVKIWDVATTREALSIHNPGHDFGAVEFSVDGKRLATLSSQAGAAGEVKLWDTITGQEVLSLMQTGTATNALASGRDDRLALSPDGTRIAVSKRISDPINFMDKRSEVTIWDATPVAEKSAKAAAEPKR